MLSRVSGHFPNNALLTLAAPLAMFAAGAQADVTISSAATQDMSCSSGVCAPTAATAVLNVGDLETMLASGNVEVTTTGSGVQADNIVVGDALSWSTASALALDAYQSVSINKPVSVQGQGGLTLTTDDGGTNGSLAFGHKGKVTFANLSSNLAINGTVYTLVSTIQSLASAVAANPSGAYALASSYDASHDGTYTTVPVPTPFTGTFEGIGNAISNLSINDTADPEVGLFAEVDQAGTLRDIAVTQANVSMSSTGSCVGPLVGMDYGNIISASATGSYVEAINACAGGLIGKLEGGTIHLSSAATKVSGVAVGGLVGGVITGNIDQSFATGKAIGKEYAGGMVGVNEGGSVANCYSTGQAQVPSSDQTYVGGFTAEADEFGTIRKSYSTGAVRGGSGRLAGTRGGFVGYTNDTALGDNYWDVDKGVHNRHKGAGNVKNEEGIVGLTTQQLQSGLPSGFDPSVWGESKKINDGLPYLLANPPRER